MPKKAIKGRWPLSQRWPWHARVEKVCRIIEDIGLPFVKIEPTETGYMAWKIWRRSQNLRYDLNIPSTESRFASFDESARILSSLRRRGLPSHIMDWVNDIRDQGVHVAKLSLDLDGLIAFLQREINNRQILLQDLQKIVAPKVPPHLLEAVNTDCTQALNLLHRAMKQARKAEVILKPAKERFLNKRSPTRKKEQLHLVKMIRENTTLTRNEAATRAAALLETLDFTYSPKQSALRVSSYE